MIQKYILYSISNPFAGYIVSYGKVDPDMPKDGSTMYEFLERQLAEHPDYRLYTYPLNGMEVNATIQETKKVDVATKSLVNQTAEDITPKEYRDNLETMKQQDISDNLPSLSAVLSAINNISNLADAKVFLGKLSRVVYWLAKNSNA